MMFICVSYDLNKHLKDNVHPEKNISKVQGKSAKEEYSIYLHSIWLNASTPLNNISTE